MGGQTSVALEIGGTSVRVDILNLGPTSPWLSVAALVATNWRVSSNFPSGNHAVPITKPR